MWHVALLLALGAALMPAQAGGDAALVTIQENVVPGQVHQFSPQLLVVSAGDTVTWRNTGDLVHTVTRTVQTGTAGPSATRLEPGDEIMHTFATPGLFLYHCEPHGPQGMRGVVFVTP